MGLLERLKKTAGLMYTTEKAATPSRVSLPREMIFRFAASGQVAWYDNKGQDFIDNGYLGNHVVFSIQDWKSQKVSLAPPLVYKVKDEKKYRKYKALMKSDDRRKGFVEAMRVKAQALEEVEGTELSKLLQRPNPMTNWSEFAYGHTTYKDIVGSAYWMASRNGINDPTKGKITEMYLPPAHEVVIRSGGITEPVGEYFLTSNPEKPIAAANVCQIRNFSPIYTTPYQHMYGLSRLHAANGMLQKYNEGTALETDIYQKRGIRDIIFPKGNQDMEPPTPTQVQTTKDKINSELHATGHGGIIANSIELGSIRVGLSPTELGVLESQKLTKQDFCALYHIPDMIFNWGEHTTYNNLSESRKIALTDAVLPELEAMKDAINHWLVPSYYPDGGYVVDFDYQVYPELQDDLAETVKWMNEANCLTTNEKRRMLQYDDDADPNANKIIVGSSLAFLDSIGTESFPTDPQAAEMFTEDAQEP